MIQPFGPWEPDSAALDMRDRSGRVTMADARGVYPSKTGYTPVPSLTEFAAPSATVGGGSPTGLLLAITSTGAASTVALPAKCVGLFVSHTTSGGHVLFAGTATKLYKYDTTLGWVDYTRLVGGNYAVPIGDYWTWAQFGSKVIACNITDTPQVIDIDTGAANFTALGGSPPASRYVAVVGEYVVLACQSAAPRKVVNSSINDATGWTIGVNQCDEQEFPDGERITGLAAGEYGWVLQEHAIRRMIFQPGYDQAFRFERVERERGCAGGYSLVCIKDTIFYLSDDGFYSFKDGPNPIGHQRVNQWFRSNTDQSRFFSVLGFTDPFAPRVYWAAYNSANSINLDRVLIYDWSLDQWSYHLQPAQVWGRQVTASVTLESLDIYGTIDGSIDAGVPYSLDSSVWSGGRPLIAAISPSGRLAFLEGPLPMEASLTTAPIRLTPSARSFVRGVEPIGIFNDATVAMRVGKRERTQNAVAFSPTLTPSTRSGIVRVRSSGRLHNFELVVTQPAGAAWAHLEGLDIDATQDGLQ